MTGGKKYSYALSFTANSRIHYTDKNSTRSPILHSLNKSIAGFPDIELRYIMGKVLQFQSPVHLVGNSVHSTYSAVGITEIREKHYCLTISPRCPFL